MNNLFLDSSAEASDRAVQIDPSLTAAINVASGMLSMPARAIMEKTCWRPGHPH